MCDLADLAARSLVACDNCCVPRIDNVYHSTSRKSPLTKILLNIIIIQMFLIPPDILSETKLIVIYSLDVV